MFARSLIATVRSGAALCADGLRASHRDAHGVHKLRRVAVQLIKFFVTHL
jgi:hypothetical protein